MRVLLINPPLAPTAEIAPPVGLCVLAANLIAHGHEVSVLDLDLELHSVTNEARNLVETLVIDRLSGYQPAVVGITSMYNNSLQAAQIAVVVKRHAPECVTVAGGPHFGAQGSESLRHISALDFVIEGEGERALVTLARRLEDGGAISDVPNLCFRRGPNEILRNQPDTQIDLTLTAPVWTNLGNAIDLAKYPRTISAAANRRAVYIEAGRGCPFKCTFCAPAQFWKRDYRVKSVDVIVAEIKYLFDAYQYDSFMLIHDLLTFDKRFVRDLCERLTSENLPIQWMANARVDLELDWLYPVMKRAGCWKLFFGIETASTRLQAIVQKNITSKQAVDTSHALANAGIDATCSFVIGHPEETRFELSQTIRLGGQLRLCGAETVQYHRLRLFPPAPMAAESLPYEFDYETLKLEFPFPGVTEDEISHIKGVPSLYTGYFAPRSHAGKPYQLAQAELFFQQLVTMAPITLGTLGALLEGDLVGVFYESLDSISLLDRYSIDWVGADVIKTWEVLQPYIAFMSARAAGDSAARGALLEGAREYERTRLLAVAKNEWSSPAAVFAGLNCVIVSLPCNLFELVSILKRGEPVHADSLAGGFQVMLVRGHDGIINAFQGEAA